MEGTIYYNGGDPGNVISVGFRHYFGWIQAIFLGIQATYRGDQGNVFERFWYHITRIGLRQYLEGIQTIFWRG